MNNTKKRQVEIAKNMLEVEIPFEDVAMISGLSIEEIETLSKSVVIRVRDSQDVLDFDLKDTHYHYNKEQAPEVDETGKAYEADSEEE